VWGHGRLDQAISLIGCQGVSWSSFGRVSRYKVLPLSTENRTPTPVSPMKHDFKYYFDAPLAPFWEQEIAGSNPVAPTLCPLALSCFARRGLLRSPIPLPVSLPVWRENHLETAFSGPSVAELVGCHAIAPA
jgi:hypothetical protein